MYKKSIYTVLLFCFALFGQAVTAQEFVQDGIRYQAVAGSNTATVLGFGSNLQTNLVIPETVALSGVPLTVTSIADNAFANLPATAMVTLTLPATITNIGNGAFNSNALRMVTYLGTTEPNIGTQAFPVISALTIALPNVANNDMGIFNPQNWGVTVGQMQFGGGIGGTTYDVTYIAGKVTESSTQSKTISVEENSLLEKPTDPVHLQPTNYTFAGWFTAMTGGTQWNFNVDRVNEDITLYGQWTQNTTSTTFVQNDILYELTSGTTVRVRGFSAPTISHPNVVIPETVIENGILFTVTAIMDQAFADRPIQSVTIPASVTNIGSSAFVRCGPLNSVTYLGSTEPSINSEAFSMMSARTVILPNALGGFTPALWGVTEGQIQYGGIGGTTYTVRYIVDGIIDDVIVSANSLLTKPKDPEKAGYTFNGWWTAINPWNFETDRVNANMQLVAGWTQNTTDTYIVGGIVYRIQGVGATGTEKVAVAEGTTASVMTNTTVVIPASILANGTNVPVTEIGTYVFGAFRDVVSVTIPASVTKVSGGSFSQCGKLASITYLGTTDPITVTPTKDFRNPNRVLYVPNATSGFDTNKDFWGTPTIVYGGQTPIVEERTETTAVVTWNLIENAVSYYLYLYSDASKTVELAVYEFDTNGDYVGQLRARSASADIVPTFNLQDLDLDKEYYVEVEAVNAEERVILAQALVIPTMESFAAGINETEITKTLVPVAYYSIMGAKLNAAPEKGVYIILYDNGTSKKVMR